MSKEFIFSSLTVFISSAFLMILRAKINKPRQKLLLSEDDIKQYHENGFLLVRNVIDGQDLVDATNVAKEMSMQQSKYGSYKSLAFHSWKTNDVLKNIVLNSKGSKIAKELIQSTLKINTIGVRLLKDAFLSYAKGSTGCGWHVDDKGFWPAHNDKTGVNVWIALSPITKKQGGGLSLAKGSHNQQWAHDAIPIIHEGTFKTCDMENLNIDIHNRFESIKVEYDMNPGDVLFLDRWCFHRAEGFREEVSDDLVLNRYSIRYMPEDSKIFEFIYQGKSLDPNLEGKGGHELRLYPDLFPEVL